MKIILILALFAISCDQKAAPQTVETQEVPSESAEADTPSETHEPAAAEPAKTTSPLDSPDALKAWKTKLQAAMDAKKWDEAKAIMKELDPEFNASFLSEFEKQKVESFDGHLDANPGKETVVQVRQEGQLEGHGELENFYWVGVIGEVDGKRKLIGREMRPKLLVCVFADRAGLTFGFNTKEASDDAALWLVEQDVQSCGTLIEVDYKKQHISVADGKLASKTMKPPQSIEYDRMEHMRE